MNPQIKYILVASALLTFFWLIYLIIFRKERNFKQRRFYLLTAVLFSFLIPLANVIIELPDTALPLKETALFDTSTFDFTQQQQITNINNSNFTVPEILGENINSRRKIEWTQVITYLYYAIAVVMLLRILVQLFVLQFHVSQSEVIKKQGYKLVINHHYKSTFSFFHWIFVHSSTKNDSGLDKIIMHERVHVRENHSIDTILFEMVCSVMWFNPFVWFMRNSIQLVHEFLADEGAINMGIDKLQYQVLMINQVAEADVVSLTSHFNSSTLKKRIKMITQSDSYNRTKYRILGILPVALILILSIALFNGCNQQKVIEKKMASDPLIQAVFSKKEIKDLAEIRLMMDQMVLAQTGETDTKTAYEKFIASVGKVKTANEIPDKIPLSHDSLVQIIKANPTLQEIWNIYEKPQYTGIELNLKGKVMEFLKQLSKENANYNSVLEGIAVAGDISPSVISDFLLIPAHYNWESEAEKLYATIVLVILTNKTITRADMYLQRAVKLLQDFNADSALFWVNKAIAIDSTNLLALQNKAGIMIRKNKHEEALNLYSKCAEINPESAETWGMMGMLNDYLGKTEEAARCYSQTIALYNRQMESGDKQKIHNAKVNKAMVLLMNNQENESRLLFKELLNENPADSTAAGLSRISKQDFLNDFSVNGK
jgi:beta-lactamase regulating signal transducer with metallopeptidase domain/tetratricopeptide (TPR) repeat protein